jgi:TIR domain
MARDVFISYATEDREVAEKVCGALEAGGVECWVAPRDVPFGAVYEEAIIDGIASSRLVVLVLSSNSNASPHVKREIQNACAEDSGKQIVPLRIDDIEYNKALRYYLGSTQWLDASTPPLEQHLGRLVEHVRATLARPGGPEAVKPTAYVNPPAPPAAGPMPPASDRFTSTSNTTPVIKGTGDGRTIKGTGDGRKPFPLALLAAGVGALVLVIVLVAVYALRGGESNANVRGGYDPNANAAGTTPKPSPSYSPTPQHTPAPTPTPNASPTPRVVRTPLNYNLNIRRPASNVYNRND